MGLHVGTYSGGTWGHEQHTSVSFLLALARRYRELGIPVDLLFLDSTWRPFDQKGGKGATSFEWRETFHHPERMFPDNSLYRLHFNAVGLHIRPRLDNGLHNRFAGQRCCPWVYLPLKLKVPVSFLTILTAGAVNW